MLDFLFGSGSKKIKHALQNGGSIIDVRTVFEYDQGRFRGSINIPLERIPASVDRIRHLNKPIIFCGSGDGRSGKAARFIRQSGITEVMDGGNWEKIAKLVRK